MIRDGKERGGLTGAGMTDRTSCPSERLRTRGCVHVPLSLFHDIAEGLTPFIFDSSGSVKLSQSLLR